MRSWIGVRVGPAVGVVCGLAAAVVFLGGIAGCSRSSGKADLPASRRTDWSSVERTGVSASPRVVDARASVPKGGGSLKVGRPYRIADRWYVPRHDPNYNATGAASWYGADFHGRKTANGEIFDQTALTAAHPTLPLPSYVTVTHIANGRTVLVRVNDRGPYARDRIIDLSRRVAGLLGFEAQGTARVRVRFVGLAPLDGNDVRERTFLAAQPWAPPSLSPLVTTSRALPPGIARPSGLGAGSMIEFSSPTWVPIR